MALVILTDVFVPLKAEAARVKAPSHISDGFYHAFVLAQIVERRVAESDVIAAGEFSAQLEAFGHLFALTGRNSHSENIAPLTVFPSPARCEAGDDTVEVAVLKA